MTSDLKKIFEPKHALCWPLAARHLFSLSASNGDWVGAKCRNCGLSDPIMVERVKVGATAEDLRSLGSDERNSPEEKVRSGPSERARASQTTANARANREFLEKALATLWKAITG